MRRSRLCEAGEQGLASLAEVDGRDELRAAGKAILILIEEIERLQVDVWRPDHGLPEPRPRVRMVGLPLRSIRP